MRTLRLLDLYGLNDFKFSDNSTAEDFIEMQRSARFEQYLAEITAKHVIKGE